MLNIMIYPLLNDIAIIFTNFDDQIVIIYVYVESYLRYFEKFGYSYNIFDEIGFINFK